MQGISEGHKVSRVSKEFRGRKVLPETQGRRASLGRLAIQAIQARRGRKEFRGLKAIRAILGTLVRKVFRVFLDRRGTSGIQDHRGRLGRRGYKDRKGYKAFLGLVLTWEVQGVSAM
jgi:hypothetical protein